MKNSTKNATLKAAQYRANMQAKAEAARPKSISELNAIAAEARAQFEAKCEKFAIIAEQRRAEAKALEEEYNERKKISREASTDSYQRLRCSWGVKN